MIWWIAAFISWLMSVTGIVYVMADVLRHKTPWNKMFPAYAFHGVTAVLALWFVLKALGS